MDFMVAVTVFSSFINYHFDGTYVYFMLYGPTKAIKKLDHNNI